MRLLPWGGGRGEGGVTPHVGSFHFTIFFYPLLFPFFFPLFPIFKLLFGGGKELGFLKILCFWKFLDV